MYFRVQNVCIVFSSKVASYFEARTKLSADLLSKKSKFASDPKSHPEYKSVWTKFYQRKQKKAEKPLSVEELQPGTKSWLCEPGNIKRTLNYSTCKNIQFLSKQNVLFTIPTAN